MMIDQATLAKPFLARWNGVIPLGNTQAFTWSSSHGFDDAHLNSGFVPYRFGKDRRGVELTATSRSKRASTIEFLILDKL